MDFGKKKQYQTLLVLLANTFSFPDVLEMCIQTVYSQGALHCTVLAGLKAFLSTGSPPIMIDSCTQPLPTSDQTQTFQSGNHFFCRRPAPLEPASAPSSQIPQLSKPAAPQATPAGACPETAAARSTLEEPRSAPQPSAGPTPPLSSPEPSVQCPMPEPSSHQEPAPSPNSSQGPTPGPTPGPTLGPIPGPVPSLEERPASRAASIAPEDKDRGAGTAGQATVSGMPNVSARDSAGHCELTSSSEGSEEEAVRGLPDAAGGRETAEGSDGPPSGRDAVSGLPDAAEQRKRVVKAEPEEAAAPKPVFFGVVAVLDEGLPASEAAA